MAVKNLSKSPWLDVVGPYEMSWTTVIISAKFLYTAYSGVAGWKNEIDSGRQIGTL
jgi:hypothetical protein